MGYLRVKRGAVVSGNAYKRGKLDCIGRAFEAFRPSLDDFSSLIYLVDDEMWASCEFKGRAFVRGLTIEQDGAFRACVVLCVALSRIDEAIKKGNDLAVLGADFNLVDDVSFFDTSEALMLKIRNYLFGMLRRYVRILGVVNPERLYDKVGRNAPEYVDGVSLDGVCGLVVYHADFLEGLGLVRGDLPVGEG